MCAGLGFERNGTAVGMAWFGSGQGQILLDEVGCTGTESSIVGCPNFGMGVHDCSHAEDAGVRCIPKPVTTQAPGNYPSKDLLEETKTFLAFYWLTIFNLL